MLGIRASMGMDGCFPTAIKVDYHPLRTLPFSRSRLVTIIRQLSFHENIGAMFLLAKKRRNFSGLPRQQNGHIPLLTSPTLWNGVFLTSLHCCVYAPSYRIYVPSLWYVSSLLCICFLIVVSMFARCVYVFYVLIVLSIFYCCVFSSLLNVNVRHTY